MIKTLEATKYVNVHVRLDPELKEFIDRFARLHDLDVSKLTRHFYRELQQIEYEKIPGQVGVHQKLGWAANNLDRRFKARHNSLMSQARPF